MIVIEMNAAVYTDVEKNIYECLKTLYQTRAGEQILDRDFGISWDMLDQPLIAAAALLQSEIIQKTRRYEPRASVEKVSCTGDYDGNLRAEVKIRFEQH